jgi:hypothetical protein
MHCSSNCRVSGIARTVPIGALVTAPDSAERRYEQKLVPEGFEDIGGHFCLNIGLYECLMQPFDAVAMRVVHLAKFYETMSTRITDVTRTY